MDPVLETDGNSCLDDLQRRMLYIDENLESRDLANLKFLCVDYLSKGLIEKADRGLHLFSLLEKTFQNKLLTLNFITECLFHLERYDLLMRVFGKTESDMRDQVASKPSISPYRLLIFSMADDLTQIEFENAKFIIIDHIPSSVRNDVNTFLKLCMALEKLNRLSQSNVDLLLEVCININRNDLEEKVIRYKQQFTASQQQRMHVQKEFRASTDVQPQQIYYPRASTNVQPQQTYYPNHDQQLRPNPPVQTNVPTSQRGSQSTNQTENVNSNQNTEASPVGNTRPNNHNPISYDTSAPKFGTVIGLNPSVQKIDHSKSSNQQPVHQQQDAEPYPAFQATPPAAQLDLECLPAYKMNARPRGLCVIISNENFHSDRHDPNSRLMKDRRGSSFDMERLKECFSNLHFEVHCQIDLNAEDMVKLMDETAKVSHQDFDCFVCCILTHGANDALYGSDGKTITMEDLTYGFKSIRCKTLLGKPKLFFIQACMGRDKQEGADIQQDSGSGQVDPAVIPRGSIPSEADFLLGYATVPGHVSYRSQTQGSWYITTLTKVLNRFAGKCDLLSMLVKVNEEVSKAVATVDDGLYKQVPAPLVTLRKRVFFQ